MIQRIQTLWFLLASLCAFAMLKLSFYSGNKIISNQRQYTHLTANETIPLTILAVVIGIVSVILIFLFKNRKRQKRLTLTTVLLSVINIILYFFATSNYFEGNYDVTAVLPFAVPVFLLFAIRGIRNDEKLIHSADRLR